MRLILVIQTLNIVNILSVEIILLDVGSNMGFISLLFSALIPLNYMGGLMVFAMLSTSLGTLTILASIIELLKPITFRK